MSIIDWPEEIAWIVPELKPYTFQPMSVTQMERGVRQRATGTPRTQYQAEIELTDREYQILTEITVSYVRARVPGATDPVVVTFVRSEDGSPNPFTVSQRMIVQGPSSYTVRIDLARAPAAVQYAG